MVGNLGCWALFVGAPPAREEVLSTLDASDTRMNQVVYTNGRLFGAIGTAFGVPSVFWINAAAMSAGAVLARRARA